MVKRLQVLAVVPARGGSKSIPRKNVRSLAGHPLLAWSIAAGLQSTLVTRVVVSTDDEEIAEAARRYGGEVPFLRPASLAEDDTPDHPVFSHLLTELEVREGYRPDVIVQLRPTTPLRPPGLVDHVVDLLRQAPSADCVRTVVPSSQNPYKMWRQGGDGLLVPLLTEIPGAHDLPRQALPATFWQTGHVDAMRPDVILARHSMTGRIVLPAFVDQQLAVDIDMPADWERVEGMLRRSDLEIVRPGPLHRPVSVVGQHDVH